ncbi:MAG: hypothetical protein II278_08910, partial [Bacteroidaceae bacterium]|nr:hypothetical protein [Bacteroidaceae bacterium]
MKSNNYTENKRGKHSAWISAFSSRKKVWLMGLSSVLLFSCTNDDIVNDAPEQPQNAYEQLTFSTADENAGKAATRAVWSDPNGKGNLIFNWEADDKGTEMVALLSDGSAFVRNYSSENPTDEDLQEALYHTY